MRFIHYAIKFFILVFAAITISSVSVPRLYAADGGDSGGLGQIAITMQGILDSVNNLPSYLTLASKFIYSWLTDESDSKSFISENQVAFATLGTLFSQQEQNQDIVQPQLTTDLLGKAPTAIQASTIDFNMNDIIYSTMLGMPPIAPSSGSGPDTTSANNYLKNVAGFGIVHPLPMKTWGGRKEYKETYTTYYKTVMAVESFNGYVLSRLLSENLDPNNSSNKLQNTLIAQASNSTWLAKITSEELGRIFRQLLLFQSQQYVLSAKILEIEKQMLTAQVMTNTLLILNNQMNEAVLISKALNIQLTA